MHGMHRRAGLAAACACLAACLHGIVAPSALFDHDAIVECRPHNFDEVLAIGEPNTSGVKLPRKIRGTGEPFGPCHIDPASLVLDETAINDLAYGLKRRLPEPEDRVRWMNSEEAEMVRRNVTEDLLAAGKEGIMGAAEKAAELQGEQLVFDGFHPWEVVAENVVSINPSTMFNPEKRDAIAQHTAPLPCGFMGEDAMEFDRSLSEFDDCRLIVVTVIYSRYDDLKHTYPSILKQLLCYIAFVDDETSDYIRTLPDYDADSKQYQGWEIVAVTKHPYVSPLKSNRVIKMLVPRLFPYARYSIYTDSSRQIRVDPAKMLYHLLIKHGAAFSMPTHYSRQNQHDEFKALVRLKSNVFDSAVLAAQQTTYSKLGFPLQWNTGLLTGCLLLRDHLSTPVHMASCAWFNEVMTYEPRDQVSFEYVTHSLGWHACPTHDDFEAIRKSGSKYAKRHMTYDMVNRALNTRFYKFEYCQLALVTNAFHHIAKNASWRNGTFFRSQLDLPKEALFS